MCSEIKLYDYWRSSSSYRVRIALNLKGISYTTVPVDLLKNQQNLPQHLARHPQGILPCIAIDGHILQQSLAIIEYLDETRKQGSLLPGDPIARARVRTLSYAIAMEIHPLCNLSVVNHAGKTAVNSASFKKDWMQHFISKGLAAFEVYLKENETGEFCHGDDISMADCCLIPQVYNARRWGVDLSEFENIVRISNICEKIPAFADARPDNHKPV